MIGLLILFKKRQHIAFIFLILGLLSALLMAWLYQPGTDPSRVYYGTDTRLFAVLLGAALAIVWPSTALKPKISRPHAWLLDGIGVLMIIMTIIMYVRIDAQSSFVYRGGMLLFTIGIVLLTAVTVHPGAHVNRWLTNPFFTWLGKRSYGIYLYQFPVMIFYENQVKNIAHLPWLHNLIQLALILLISEISYRLVEKPQRNARKTLRPFALAAFMGRTRSRNFRNWFVWCCKSASTRHDFANAFSQKN